MLLRIDDATVINIQNALRLYVSESTNGYAPRCETLDNVYTIKECKRRSRGLKPPASFICMKSCGLKFLRYNYQ